MMELFWLELVYLRVVDRVELHTLRLLCDLVVVVLVQMGLAAKEEDTLQALEIN